MILTPSQKRAASGFFKFLTQPDQKVMCLIGYAGCGKSTLVKHIIEKLPERIKVLNLLTQCGDEQYDIRLTATTNKATSVLADLDIRHPSIRSVTTIHSLLGLVPRPDFKTGKQTLVQARNGGQLEPGKEVIFVDEGSFVNMELLDAIMGGTSSEKKIVFVLDEFQLAPPGETGVRPAVAGAGFPEYRLEEVMRNGGAIAELSAQFRESVQTGRFKRIVDNGDDIIWCDGPRFKREIADHFTDPKEAANHRILAWRNATVQGYNNHIRKELYGMEDPNRIVEGETLIVNDIVECAELKTDQAIEIFSSTPGKHEVNIENTQIDIDGYWVRASAHGETFFVPGDPVHAKKLFAAIAAECKRGQNSWQYFYDLKNNWGDLRPAHACTVHKSQGSTYGKVFINLTDIGACHERETVARILYVATSRPRTHIYLYGNLPRYYGGY